MTLKSNPNPYLTKLL